MTGSELRPTGRLVRTRGRARAELHRRRCARAPRPLVERVADGVCELGLDVATGVFGARMEVELVNDGPVTIVLDA